MDPETLRAALERFASDLSIAGEPATFDVVVARHLPLFLSAREAGLKATRLARLLAQSGAKRSQPVHRTSNSANSGGVNDAAVNLRHPGPGP